jgi:hypothetical protein
MLDDLKIVPGAVARMCHNRVLVKLRGGDRICRLRWPGFFILRTLFKPSGVSPPVVGAEARDDWHGWAGLAGLRCGTAPTGVDDLCGFEGSCRLPD